MNTSNENREMKYWEECLSEAFNDAGINVTQKQLETVASWVEGAHENHGLATGDDVASANFISDDRRELDEIKKAKDKHEMWINSTNPCKTCTTTGNVIDGWGKQLTCPNCDGKGRTHL